MRVKDAIKYLQELPEDEEIILAWWDYEWWTQTYPVNVLTPLTKEQWNEFAEGVEGTLNWEFAYDQMSIQFERYLSEQQD